MAGEISTDVRQILDLSQDGCNSEILQKFKVLYSNMEKDKFWWSFESTFKHFLVVGEKQRVVDNAIEFVAKFAVSENQENDELQDSFLTRLFDFLLKHSQESNSAVRLRICQTVSEILKNMSAEAEIEETLIEKLTKSMLKRLKDRVGGVRAQAVHALYSLQDPKNKQCPVISAYLFHLEKDPIADVRKAILSCIPPTSNTLMAIYDRTRDIEPSVRIAAYTYLSTKVSFRCLTISQRVQLLNDGLQDREESVKKIVKQKLLPFWMKLCNNCPLTLLNILDVENSSDIAELALKAYFETMKNEELTSAFAAQLEERYILCSELTCENSFYWRCLAQHLHDPSSEDCLESILPDLPPFCEYIHKYVDQFSDATKLDEKLLEREFILCQLILLTRFHSIADESCRKQALNLIQELLMSERVSGRLVEPLVGRLSAILVQQDSTVSFLMEVIDEIRVPITEHLRQQQRPRRDSETRRHELQLAKIRVEMNEAKEKMEACVADQDFAKALELKPNLKELEDEKEALLSSAAPVPLNEATVIAKSDPETLIKCLSIAKSMLQLEEVNVLTPSLQSLVENLILPSVQNGEPAVRNPAVLSLGLTCLLNRDLAARHLLLFLSVLQVDEEAIRITAGQVIMDLLTVFGVAEFDTNRDTTTCSNRDTNADLDADDEDDDDDDDASETILKGLIKLLENSTMKVRSVVTEGLGKLLFANRFASTKLLSRLILMWYNPATEDDSYLRHFLGVFLPSYASTSRDHKDQIEQAFMLTLQTIFDAPLSSPLSKVDPYNVAKLMIELTRERRVREGSAAATSGMKVHDSLALKLCNEIISNLKSANVRVFSKALLLLDLTASSETFMKDLNELSQKTIKKVKDNVNSKLLQKFNLTVSKLLQILQNPGGEDVFKTPRTPGIVRPRTTARRSTRRALAIAEESVTVENDESEE